MSDFDDDHADLVNDLLAEAGGSFSYFRGATGTTVTLRKSVLVPMFIDAGNGTQIEVRPVDFIGLTSALPHDPPLRGDRIVGGGKTYEVLPTTGEKVFRQISDKMTRIHTKQIG